MMDTADLSIFTLITHAGIVVKIVLAILVVFSLASWTVIFQKWFQITKAKRESTQFDRSFWGGSDLNNLYESANNRRTSIGSMEGIFYSGMTEFLRTRSSRELNQANFGVIDSVARAMRARYQRELDQLESGLSLLATIGSVSPYIGLFGTVWGIMDAFTGLSNLESASLAVVAPGIAEALVATAIGLFAAIPAVIGYNRFAYAIDRLSNQYESFMEEFQNILNRQA
ncbi:MAG: protein TolQ [Burkholderiaceae bacterium]|nr:protein TolQ [Burkholderiaceae bacterium]